MAEGSFRKICVTLRRDQVEDLKARSRNVSKIVRDAIDYYLTLDIGSSDIAVYEIRRDVKKLLALASGGRPEPKVPKEEAPSKRVERDLGPLSQLISDEKDEKILRLMLERTHESTKKLVADLGYSRSEGVRDKLNSLNARCQQLLGRPLFRYFRSKEGFDYSWWMMADMEELTGKAKASG